MKALTTVAGKRIALARFHMADNPCWIASENDAIRHVCYHHRSYPYNCMSTDRDFFPTYRVGADVCAFADGTSSHDSGIRSDERKFAQSNVMTDVASAANTNVPAADNARLDYRAPTKLPVPSSTPSAMTAAGWMTVAHRSSGIPSAARRCRRTADSFAFGNALINLAFGGHSRHRSKGPRTGWPTKRAP
jgi:hypothetical protein